MKVVTSSQDPIELPNGIRITPVIDRTNSDADRLSVAKVEMPPNTAIPAHFHRRTEEVYILQAGTGKMRVAGDYAELRPGESVRIEPNTMHSIENVGSGSLVFLAVCNPAFSPDDEIYVEQDE